MTTDIDEYMNRDKQVLARPKLLSAWVPMNLFGMAFVLAAVRSPACSLFFFLGMLTAIWRFAQAMRNFAENREEYVDLAPLIEADGDCGFRCRSELDRNTGSDMPELLSFHDDNKWANDLFFSPENSWNPANVFHHD